MHENMLWCFPNPPMGVYHICRLVACHSHPVTLPPASSLHQWHHDLAGPGTFLSTFLLLLVSSYIYQKSPMLGLQSVSCELLGVIICQNLKLCYSCHWHISAP